jgi:hypothetical protein
LSFETCIDPHRWCDVCQNHAHRTPEQNNDKFEDTLCDEKIDKKSNAISKIRVGRGWGLVHIMEENDTLP